MDDGKTMIFCTIFDSYYLDKGLALINSLNKVCEEYRLYVLAFDNQTEKILKDLHFQNVTIISLEQFETTQLLQLKEERSKAEYCWTCTSVLIEYVFEKFGVDYCTYIDADMYFYSSPVILLNEFIASGASVGLTPHRFPKTVHGEKILMDSGKYCVEFNTFKNDEAGRRLLNVWKQQCLNECSMEKCGDQRYLTDWGDKYSEVYDYQNIGGGVAPWNLVNYKIKGDFPDFVVSDYKQKNRMVFYHFQGIAYSGDGRIKMNILLWVDNGFVPRMAIRKIYYPYLNELEHIRSFLAKKYDIIINANSGRMEFEQVKFVLSKFMDTVFSRIKSKNYYGAIDLVFRVIRKKQDIVYVTREKRID